MYVPFNDDLIPKGEDESLKVSLGQATIPYMLIPFNTDVCITDYYPNFPEVFKNIGQVLQFGIKVFMTTSTQGATFIGSVMPI